tara:strand:- start:242 stop:631 length:390 start_codon:yes stop_codon:yes gene_type:complete
MIIVAVFLILYNTRENISYFYTPSEVDFSKININQKMRLGGYVEVDSFTKLSSSSFKFKITDEKKSINVNYIGILPDLFREGQGAVIEGYFENKEMFNATTVFAKHDENYMPSSIKSKLENSGYWNKKY